MVDFWDRWIYKGSMLEPPCDSFVYWNVLRTVYPIKPKYLELFKEQLGRDKKNNLNETGNWREI